MNSILCLSPQQHAALTLQARRRAERLRNEAIADALATIGGALKRAVYKALRLCRLPVPEF